MRNYERISSALTLIESLINKNKKNVKMLKKLSKKNVFTQSLFLL